MKEQKVTVTVQVRMVLPPGANGSDAVQYIGDAVQSHGGGLDPEHPFFSVKRGKDFTVRMVKRKVETTYG